MSKRSLNRPFAKLDRRLAREKEAREKAALEKAALEKAALEKAALEQAALEKAARKKEAQETAAREQLEKKEAQQKLAREHAKQTRAAQLAPRPAQPADAASPAGASKLGAFATLAQRGRIKPLDGTARRVERVPDIQVAAKPAARPQAPTEHYEVEQTARFIEGRRIDVDLAALDKLRRSHPRSRVDLHGMPAEQARRHLHRFVLGQHTNGCRELLVIVGKGLHSPGGLAVLRTEVAGWLTETKMAPFVLAFVSARGEHGGNGALYVQLQRKRS